MVSRFPMSQTSHFRWFAATAGLVSVERSMTAGLDPLGGVKRRQLPWNNERDYTTASLIVAGGGGNS